LFPHPAIMDTVSAVASNATNTRFFILILPDFCHTFRNQKFPRTLYSIFFANTKNPPYSITRAYKKETDLLLCAESVQSLCLSYCQLLVA
jgi:hypothetical protein